MLSWRDLRKRGWGEGRERKETRYRGGIYPPTVARARRNPGFLFTGVNFYDRRPSLTISPARELSRACNRNRGPRDKPSPSPPSRPLVVFAQTSFSSRVLDKAAESHLDRINPSPLPPLFFPPCSPSPLLSSCSSSSSSSFFPIRRPTRGLVTR